MNETKSNCILSQRPVVFSFEAFFLRSCAMDFYSDEELKTLCDAVSVEPIIGEVFSKPFK